MKTEFKSDSIQNTYPCLKRYTNNEYDYIVLFDDKYSGTCIFLNPDVENKNVVLGEYANKDHRVFWTESEFIICNSNMKVTLSN